MRHNLPRASSHALVATARTWPANLSPSTVHLGLMSLRRSSRLATTSVYSEGVVSTQTISITEVTSRTSKKRPRLLSTARVSEERSTGQRQEDGEDEKGETQKKKRKRKKAEVVYKLQDFPARGSSRWKVGPHVSAAGGVENTIINAASIGCVLLLCLIVIKSHSTTYLIQSYCVCFVRKVPAQMELQ